MSLLLVRDYVKFLKAVAATSDPHGLYDLAEDDQITLIEVRDTVDYQAVDGQEYQPMHHLTEHDVMRYCNWKDHNSPTSAEMEEATESGTYDFSEDDQVVINDHGQYRAGIDGDGFAIIRVSEEIATAPMIKE